MPISEIPNYISQKVQEKKAIEQELEELRSRKSELERDTITAMQNYAITQEKLDWYSKIKQELEKYGILVDDISKLGAMVNNVAKIFGYNATKLGDALSNLQSLENDCQWYERRLEEERDERDSLRNQRSRLQADVESCSQALAAYSSLCDIGFGLKELKLLWHTIREIADANSIPVKDAIKKFFKDTEDDYDDKLGFELKKDKLQQEVNDLNQKKLELLALVHTAFPKLAVAIAKLISAYGNNNKNIAEEFGLLVDLVLKAGGVGSFIQKLTSYQVAVAGRWISITSFFIKE
jgi:chromosome segregation ATPase